MVLQIHAPFAVNLSYGAWNVRIVDLKTMQCDKLLQDWVAFVDVANTSLLYCIALPLPQAVTLLLSVLL